MIQILIGDVSLSEYITDYNINIAAIESENSFTAADGEIIAPVVGEKVTIRLMMKKVPHNLAQTIKSASDGDFTLTYTTPAAASNSFRRTEYSAQPRNSDPREKNPLITDNITWDISTVFECKTQKNGEGYL